MKEVVYKCNLCGDRRDRENMVAVHIQQANIKLLKPTDADFDHQGTHVCKWCIETIKKVTM